MPSQEPYPSSLSDVEWKLIEPLVPGPQLFGRPPRYAKRAILDAIFYVVRGGIAWRLLPHDLPPWRIVYYYFMVWRREILAPVAGRQTTRIVYYYFMVWRREGLWQKIHDTLRDQVRLRSGKKKPRPLRSSTLRALKWLTTEECAATMQARKSWDANDTSWWTRWG